MIVFTCTCGKKYKVDDKFAGKRTRCAKCHSEIEIPKDSATPQEKKPTHKRLSDTTPHGPIGEHGTSPGKVYKSESSHRVLRDHAQGGMGRISVTLDEKLNRKVALKELFPEGTRNRNHIGRFIEEAEITAQLEHPGVVPIHAYGVNGEGSPFYTMKFVHGTTLQHALKEYYDIPVESELKMASLRSLIRRFAAVCQTMAFAHEQGIMHRDLKPANIMLGPHGETLVMDWGLAKSFTAQAATHSDVTTENETGTMRHDQTRYGAALGTPPYMPPEQAKGEWDKVGPLSDVYSLGAILYEILCGYRPFTGSSSEEILQKVITREGFYEPSILRRGVPKELEAIALKAMAEKPEDRYQNATRLEEDITNWLDDEPVSVKPETRNEKLQRWIRKNSRLAKWIAFTVCLMLLLLGTVAAVHQRSQAKIFAAQMLAEELQRRLDEAIRKLAEKEKELATAELELEKAYANLLKLPPGTPEYDAARKHIDDLTKKIETLEREIAQLQSLVEGLSDETTGENMPNNTGPLQRAMTLKLVETLIEIAKRKQELFTVSAEYRKQQEQLPTEQRNKIKQRINDSLMALSSDKSLSDEQRELKKEDVKQNTESSFYSILQLQAKHSEEQYQLNQLRLQAMTYFDLASTTSVPQSLVLSACDCLPIDWDVVNDPNALFVGDFIDDFQVEMYRDIYTQNQTRQYPNLPVIANRECEQFIFAHARSVLKVSVPDNAVRLTAVGGVNKNFFEPEGKYTITQDEADSNFWTYQIWLDGKLVYESDVITNYKDASVFIDVPIPQGTKTLEMIIDPNGGNFADHSIWGWPIFHVEEKEEEPFIEDEDGEPHLIPIQVNRNRLPERFLSRLRDFEAEIAQNGGYAVAGQVEMNGAAMSQSTDFTVGVIDKRSRSNGHPTSTFERGWFITGVITQKPDQDEKKAESPRIRALSAQSTLFDMPYRYREGRVNFYRIVLNPAPQDQLGDVTGRVLTEEGGLAVEANVEMTYSSVPGVGGNHGVGNYLTFKTKTDNKGNYSFHNIMPHDYNIRVSLGGYEWESKSLKKGNFHSSDILLSRHRRVFIDVVYQPDGSTDFTKNSATRNQFVLDTSSYKIAGTDSDIGDRIRFDPTQKSAYDLLLSSQDLKLIFYAYGNKSGHYDAGKVDFDSVNEADTRKIRQIYNPALTCQEGHVYVCRTSDNGHYAKFIVRKIEIVLPKTVPTPKQDTAPAPRPRPAPPKKEKMKEEEPHLTPIQADRSVFPENFLARVRRVETEIAQNGGYAVAGQVGVDGSAMSKPTDFTIGVLDGRGYSTLNSEKGWFVTMMPIRSQQSNGESPRIKAFGAKTVPFDMPYRYEMGKVNFYRIALKSAPKNRLKDITGRVLTERGRPLADADVHLYKTIYNPVFDNYGGSYQLTLKTQTNNKGVYTFRDILPLDYTVEASHRGYEGNGTYLYLDAKSDISLPRHSLIYVDFVYQPDGTPDFTKSNIKKGQLKIDTSRKNKYDPRFSKSIRFDPDEEMHYADDLALRYNSDLKLSFSHGYSGPYKTGHYDAGKVNFNSIKQADLERIQSHYNPATLCREGHVYVCRTRLKGYYVKFIVRKIEAISPEEIMEQYRNSR